MEHFSIRPFEEGDIDFALEMNVTEQWGDTRKDIERMFSYQPRGCFVAEANDERVGHVFSTNYGKLGWIGLLIVKAEHRRNGIGTLLTKKAIDYLLSHGVETIRLEAVPAITNLYRKLGFSDEYDSLRFMGETQRSTLTADKGVKPLKRNMIKRIAEFDAEYFGADRTRVLVQLYRDYPKLCFVSHAQSKVAGYIMCRETENGYRAGPWICDPEDAQAARELLAKCMERMGQHVKLFVGVPAVNKIAVEILREFGFEQYSKSIRMRLGKQPETDRVEGVFAIGGPEKG